MNSSATPTGGTPPTTRDDIDRLVRAFYADVFADAEIGPIFAPFAAERWPQHLERMVEFWCTTLLRTKSFRGNVLVKHVNLLPQLQPAHFARWLTLWARHTERHIAPVDAAELQATAAGIARNLHLGCFGNVPRFANEHGELRLVST
jgi:hemoglobin